MVKKATKTVTRKEATEKKVVIKKTVQSKENRLK